MRYQSISNNWQLRGISEKMLLFERRRWTLNRFWPSQHHFWYLVLCWQSSYWFGIGESFIRWNVLDPLCRLDLYGHELGRSPFDLLVGTWSITQVVIEDYSAAILSITGSSSASRALLKRVIISGSPPLSGWCWTASDLWACLTFATLKRPVNGKPRLWRALMASISGSRPSGHCSRRWFDLPGLRLAFEALDRLVVEAPNPPAPLSLLVTRLLVTDWWDCNVPSQCLSAWQKRQKQCHGHRRGMVTTSPRGNRPMQWSQSNRLGLSILQGMKDQPSKKIIKSNWDH